MKYLLLLPLFVVTMFFSSCEQESYTATDLEGLWLVTESSEIGFQSYPVYISSASNNYINIWNFMNLAGEADTTLVNFRAQAKITGSQFSLFDQQVDDHTIYFSNGTIYNNNITISYSMRAPGEPTRVVDATFIKDKHN